MRKSSPFHALLLLICWTGFIAAGTFGLLKTTVRQYLALSYSTTRGKIVKSEVGHGAINRRGIDIEYNYTVDGEDYTGHRYRYDDHNVTFEWETAVEDMPRWSSHTVYYNPNDPADSLLEPGVDGADLLLLLFSLPLNMLTAVLWRAMIARLREDLRTPTAGGVRIRKEPDAVRVPLGDTSALGAACYVMAGVAFVAAFPVVITGGFEPSLRLVARAWMVVVVAGVFAFFWRAVKNLSGIYDLRIDPAGQTVTLPQTAGRRSRVSLARGEISGVSMQRRTSKSPSGIHFSFLPALRRSGPAGESQSIKLITWGWTEDKARAFSQWLSQELNVEFKGVEEELPQGTPKN